MTDNPNKKTFWDKVHLDPTMLLILLALLVYSALVIWSASGQDIGMMERKIGQIAMGLVIMVVMAQIPPRVYEGWAPYLYIICIILLVAVDAFGAISKGAQRWLDLGIVRFQPSEIAKIAVPLMVARFINRDVCPPSLKNTGIALVLIFMPTLLVAAQPDLGTSRVTMRTSSAYSTKRVSRCWRPQAKTALSPSIFQASPGIRRS